MSAGSARDTSNSAAPFVSTFDIRGEHTDGPQTSNPALLSMTPEESLLNDSTSHLTMSDKLSPLPLSQSNRHASPSYPPSLELPGKSGTGRRTPTQGVLVMPSSSKSSIKRQESTHRVSFDDDRPDVLTPAIKPPSERTANQNDASARSPPARVADLRASNDSSPSSRARSPRRLFQWQALRRGRSREEPFEPVDPFRFQWGPKLQRLRSHSFDLHINDLQSDLRDAVSPVRSCLPGTTERLEHIRFIMIDLVPRQTYLHLLLRLPSLYFSRVARIFIDAEISRPDVQRLVDACREGDNSTIVEGGLPPPDEWQVPTVSAPLARFKMEWEEFVQSLMKEWKTLNLVSALLLSAILTLLQIQEADSDPVTRSAALLSMTCALMSIGYGCVYVVRFGTMKSMYKATRWAEDARNTKTNIFWNSWVFLSLPAVWLAWSMVLFVFCILSFVWRTGSTSDPDERPKLSPKEVLGPRIAVTFVFCVGLLYFALVVRTLQRYGGEPNWKREYGDLEIAREAREAGFGDVMELARGRRRDSRPLATNHERGSRGPSLDELNIELQQPGRDGFEGEKGEDKLQTNSKVVNVP